MGRSGGLGRRSSISKGPKGKVDVVLPPGVSVEFKDGQVLVARPDDSRESRSLHGAGPFHLANAAKGVATGWERKLDIRGVGFRAEVKGRQLHMSLGYSHPVVFDLPDGITAEVDKVNGLRTAYPPSALPCAG